LLGRSPAVSSQPPRRGRRQARAEAEALVAGLGDPAVSDLLDRSPTKAQRRASADAARAARTSQRDEPWNKMARHREGIAATGRLGPRGTSGTKRPHQGRGHERPHSDHRLHRRHRKGEYATAKPDPQSRLTRAPAMAAPVSRLPSLYTWPFPGYTWRPHGEFN
jgi:hypothetical protein